MASIREIFEQMPRRYRVGQVSETRSYYFSIGDLKYTVLLTPESCTVETGKTLENANCVLKTTPELFERMVVQGKLPGAMDIALGRIKTNDPAALQALRAAFDFSKSLE